jgi:iron(III) transport system ATP-binding protein
VVQAGAPEDVYARPADRWVAEFLGAAEILPATVDDAGEGGIARCELGLLPTRSSRRGPAEVVVRPEAIVLRPRRADSPGTRATVVGREYFGHDQLVRVELGSGRVVRSRAPGGMHFRVGDEVDVCAEGDVWVVDAEVGDQRPAAQPTA